MTAYRQTFQQAVLPQLLRIDPTPARVRGGVQAHRCLMGRRWIILKGGNREEVLMSISSGEELWGFEGSRCGVK